MPDTDLRRKLAWLIRIRAVISTILLGSATFVQLTSPGSFPVNPFFFLIGLTYGLTLAYAATLRYVGRFRWLVDLQLAGDALIVSAFIYFTGGIVSYFSFLYVLQRDGADSEFPSLGAARNEVNKTIVHPEKLTRSKAEYAAEKAGKK